MKRKIISAILAAAMTVSPICAFAGEYYGDAPLPDIYFSDIDDQTADSTAFDAAMDNLYKCADAKNIVGVEAALADIDFLDEQQYTAYSLAYLKTSQHNTDENNLAYEQIHSDMMDQMKREIDFLKKYADNRLLRDSLIEWCGSEEMLDELVSDKYNDRMFELSEQETALITEYNNNTLDSAVYTDTDGSSYTLSELYDLGMEAWITGKGEAEAERINRLYAHALENAVDTLGDIYTRMVKVRTELAKESGYDNYADYANAEIYRRDFTQAEIEEFRSAVKEYIVPIYNRFYDYSYDSYISSLDEEKLTETVGKGMAMIAPELKESYDYMINRGFYDICDNEDRITPGTAYTTTIGDLPVPFVFISAIDDDTAESFAALIHEYGHFNSMLHSALEYGSYTDELIDMTDPDNSAIDIQEVYSQGLEMLFTEQYPQLMTLWGSLTMTSARISSMLTSIIDGCIMDEWQETVYRSPDMTIDQINDCYSSITDSYGLGYAEFPEWMGVPHNFLQPMYYISYAVSAAAALDLWVSSLDDYDKATDRYMKLTAAPVNSFKQMLADNGFSNIFDKNQIKRIADAADSFCRGGYYDVTSDDWYIDYAKLTQPFFDNSGDSTHFRGDDAMTRGETANTVGAMNEYATSLQYTGTSTFTDAQTSYAAWAAASGVIKGYDENTLGADDTLTREQAVTILYRYAKHEALEPELEDGFGISDFPDSADISGWAEEAFDWAAAAGIILGVDTDGEQILAPQKNLTRAEFAAMISRLIIYSEMKLGKG